MTSNLNDLSKAVVLYLGYGVAASPICDDEKLIEIYGQRKGVDLSNDVRRLTNEANQIPIDWDNSSLLVAGKNVHAEMQKRYPQLDNEAFDAIA